MIGELLIRTHEPVSKILKERVAMTKSSMDGYNDQIAYSSMVQEN